ncbi:hypothetical protein F4775DRAFT_589457 [Biscogniauxia sp. FL1348]|nr:hypothetical protein F4775DRAFT_589457 [Biscogniauxia sp. FL1348]
MAPISTIMAMSSPIVNLYHPTPDPLLSPRTPNNGSCMTPSRTISSGESQATSPTPTSHTLSPSATGGGTAPVLSYSAIAGIVVGVIASLGITVVGFYLFLTRTLWVEQRQARQLEEREKCDNNEAESWEGRGHARYCYQWKPDEGR